MKERFRMKIRLTQFSIGWLAFDEDNIRLDVCEGDGETMQYFDNLACILFVLRHEIERSDERTVTLQIEYLHD